MEATGIEESGFRFLDLPGEIRKIIYRYLLLAEHVTTYRPNPAYHFSTVESDPIRSLPRPETGPVGTISSPNVSICRSNFVMGILRANRQVRAEASVIFQDENIWITLACNIRGFCQAIRNSGFNVMPCWKFGHLTRSTLDVRACFPNQNTAESVDFAILNVASITSLTRAIWTARGMEGVFLDLELNIGVATHAKMEDALLGPFLRLRGIRGATVQGSPKYASIIPQLVVEPHKDVNEISLQMDLSLAKIEELQGTQSWTDVADTCESASSFLTDCYRIYGYHLMQANLDVYRLLAVKMAYIALHLAEAKLYLEYYEQSLKYARYAMDIIEMYDYQSKDSHVRPHVMLLVSQVYTARGDPMTALKIIMQAQEHSVTRCDMVEGLDKIRHSLDPDPAIASEKFQELITALETQRAMRQQAEQAAHKTALPQEVSQSIEPRQDLRDETPLSHAEALCKALAALHVAGVSQEEF